MKRLLKAFLYSCILALLCVFSISLFWQDPLLLAGIIAAISIVMLIIWRDKEDIYLYIITGLSGAIAEIVAIAFGVWNYAIANVTGTPIWLPFLWGLSAVFVKKTAEEIHDFVRN